MLITRAHEAIYVFATMCFAEWCMLTHPFFGMTEPLEDDHFKPNYNTITCDTNEVSCFMSISQLPQSFVVPVPTCLKRVAGQKFRISIYL